MWQRAGPDRAVEVALFTLVVAGVLAAVVLKPFLRKAPSSLPSDRVHTAEPDALAAPEVVPTDDSRPGARVRLAAFSLLLIASIAAIVGIVGRAHQDAVAASRASGAYLATISTNQATTPSGGPTAPLTASVGALLARPHLLVLDTATGPNFGRLEVVDAKDPKGPRRAYQLVLRPGRLPGEGQESA